MRNKKEKRESGKERDVSFRPSLSLSFPPSPPLPFRRLQRKLIFMYPVGHEPIYNTKLQVKSTGTEGAIESVRAYEQG